MRAYLISSSVAVTLLATVSMTPVAAQSGKSTPPPAPAPRPFKLVAPHETVLPNGLRLVVVESHAAPVVSMSLSIPAGDVHDPAGKEGVAAMTAVVLTRGTTTRSAEEISAVVENVGGSLNAGAGKEFVAVNAQVMAVDAPLAFELLSDVVMRPSFPTAEIELFRSQLLAALQVQQSQPAAVANRIFGATMYGAHPLGRVATPASVGAMTREDVVRAHRERFRPGGSMLVIAGAITPARASALANEAFAKWTGTAPAASFAKVTPAAESRQIVLVNRPGSVQSAIVAGHGIGGLTGQGYFAMLASHLVLGGGNGARLNRALRIEKGWTYGASTTLSRYRGGPGMLRASAEVRTEVTDSAVAEIIRQYDLLSSAPVDTGELALTKRRLLGSLPLQNEVASDIATSVATYRQLGLPSTYLDSLQRGVAAVTPAHVQAVARQSLDADALVIVVVGDAAALGTKLRPFGRVKVVTPDGAPVAATRPAAMVALDPSRIAARRDTFALVVQGNAVGGVIQAVERDAKGIRLVDVLSVPGQTQRTENRLDAAGRQVSMAGDVTLGGSALETRLSYAGGRVTGTATVPTAQGPKTVKADTTVGPGTLDESAVGALVPYLSWSDGARHTLPVYVAGAGRTFDATLAVTAKESVTVSAGTFEAWKIAYTGTPQSLTYWVATAPPHRMVRIAIDGQPVVLELVK